MNELDKLRIMLTEAKIPYENYVEGVSCYYSDEAKQNFIALYGEAGKYSLNQVVYGRSKNGKTWKFDGICNKGSYGAKQGLIETYGELGVDKTHEPRVMTADEAFAIISAHWNGLDEKIKEQYRQRAEEAQNEHNEKL